MTYEKAITDIIRRMDDEGTYLGAQNQWAADIAIGDMIKIAKELDNAQKTKSAENFQRNKNGE